MKLEARRDHLRLTLETNNLEAHALMTDQREAVTAALNRAASWFQEEVTRLLASPVSAPMSDVKPWVPGGGIIYVEGGADPLEEFRPQSRRHVPPLDW